jgi:hypothetical protein
LDDFITDSASIKIHNHYPSLVSLDHLYEQKIFVAGKVARHTSHLQLSHENVVRRLNSNSFDHHYARLPHNREER